MHRVAAAVLALALTGWMAAAPGSATPTGTKHVVIALAGQAVGGTRQAELLKGSVTITVPGAWATTGSVRAHPTERRYRFKTAGCTATAVVFARAAADRRTSASRIVNAFTRWRASQLASGARHRGAWVIVRTPQDLPSGVQPPPAGTPPVQIDSAGAVKLGPKRWLYLRASVQAPRGCDAAGDVSTVSALATMLRDARVKATIQHRT